VDSTNNYAMGMVHAGMAQHGTVVFTHHQTKGKGQRHKQWVSTPDKNIAVSIILEPSSLLLQDQFLLSMAVAVAAYRFFKTYSDNQTKVKWPNDIYWRDRKAGGILIENVIQGTDWKYAIVGIGVNINQTAFPDLGQNAVSLKQITGKTFDPLLLTKELLVFLETALTELNKDQPLIMEAYHATLYKRNETVRLKNKNRVFEATIKGVSKDGCLITQHGIEERFTVGEIEWLRDAP
jgi:BirA family transcriptional regulator, biotin operon repressor / biotin---[acetyl-CoA-carboxylase] ligase